MVGIKETVLLQRPDHTADDYGSTSRAWTDIVEFKATLAAVGAGEMLRMDRNIMDFTHRLWIDYHKAKSFIDDLVPEGRFKINNEYYLIVAIEQHFRRQTVVLLRREI
jgi:head-tail adaptor